MGRRAVKKERRDNSKVLMEWAEKAKPQLLEKGLEGLTVDRLATIIGCSKATVYSYLTSKDELVEAVVRLKLAEIEKLLSILSHTEKNFISRCEEVLKGIAGALGGVSPLFLHDLKKSYPAIWATLEAFIEKVRHALMDFYKEGIKEKVFLDIRPELLWLSDQSMLNVLIQPDVLQKHNITVQQAFEDFIRLKFYGILPR